MIPLHVYFGNLHSHTGLSDGTGTPEEAYAYARDVAGLDFLAITEHNHMLGGPDAAPATQAARYDELVRAADQMDAPGRFVTVAGQEFSSISTGNHVNVLDVRAPIDVPNGAFDQLLGWMAEHGGVLQLNHPDFGASKPGLEYGRDDFGDEAEWIERMGGTASLIEILNGESDDGRPPQVMEASYQRFLQLGFRVAPTGNQDNHLATWGTSTSARTGVIAPALTRSDLLAALRARHVYATEDPNLSLVFRVGQALMGDTVPAVPAKATVTIADADEPSASYVIELVRGQVGGPPCEVVGRWEVVGNGDHTLVIQLGVPRSYQYFRVTQQGDDRAWTAPIWFEA